MLTVMEVGSIQYFGIRLEALDVLDARRSEIAEHGYSVLESVDFDGVAHTRVFREIDDQSLWEEIPEMGEMAILGQ